MLLSLEAVRDLSFLALFHTHSHVMFVSSHPSCSISSQVCSGSTGDGIQMALAHTNLHWGMLAVATPNSPTRRGSSPAMVAGTPTATAAAAAVAALESKRRGSAYAPAYA